MTRQQFRLLVVLNQLLLFGGFFVEEMTNSALPPELQSYPTSGESVVDVGIGASSEQFLYWLWFFMNFATLLAAVGLCLGRKWGRILYLVGFILSVFRGLLIPVSVSTNWPNLLFGLYATTEGMILALAYFSHLKRMFDGDENPVEDNRADA